jgi:RNA polymerase sigma-70 factor (ECF subfamily)
LTAEQTDWPQILRLYDQLLQHLPTPVVALNRAVAVAEVEGPAAALVEVDTLGLDSYYLFHATRADLLARLDHVDDAAVAYDRALALTTNATERAFLERRRKELSA